MKRSALLALTALLALSACSGGSAVPASAPARMPSGAALAPYQIPVVTSVETQAAEGAAKSTARSIKNSYGGVPTMFASLSFIDAPGGVDAVNLAIVGVEALGNATAYPLATYDKPVTIDALNFRHTALLLGSNDIPAIAYDGLRFIIDESKSSVVRGGRTYPMVVGSYDKATRAFAASAGPIVPIDFAMPFEGGAGGSLQLIMDFSAFESIRIAGGVADVAPVMHGASLVRSGVIVGKVVNSHGTPVVDATIEAVGDDGSIAATAPTGSDGAFELHGMRAGSYHVVVANTFETKSGQTVTAQHATRSESFAPASVYIPEGYRCDVGGIAD
ncbi:MAG: carboxypeptidase regulatory-like domain-containing protein [Candidatus Velthaea sp.]